MIKHLIVFNIPATMTHEACIRMLERGKQQLTQIPGVIGYYYGVGVAENATYKYTLCVDFTDESVIESYKIHPIHTDFADNWFRPMAADRVTTDYVITY